MYKFVLYETKHNLKVYVKSCVVGRECKDINNHIKFN